MGASARMPNQAKGYAWKWSSPSVSRWRALRTVEREPSAPTRMSQRSSSTGPSSPAATERNRTPGVSESTSSTSSTSVSKRTSPPSRRRAAARSTKTSFCAYRVTVAPTSSGKSRACDSPSKRRMMPRCSSPTVLTRPSTPMSVSISTLGCSRMPARWVCAMVSGSRDSRTTLSIPCRASRWESIRPAGPPPTMPTRVRVTGGWVMASFPGDVTGRAGRVGPRGRGRRRRSRPSCGAGHGPRPAVLTQ